MSPGPSKMMLADHYNYHIARVYTATYRFHSLWIPGLTGGIITRNPKLKNLRMWFMEEFIRPYPAANTLREAIKIELGEARWPPDSQ